MKRCLRPARFTLLALLLGTGSSLAAPILPHHRQLTDELASLISLEKASLHVHTRQASPTDRIRMPIQAFRDWTVQICNQQELAIDSQTEDVRLNIHISFHGNVDHPKLMSYVVHLGIEQRMELPRLKRAVMVPTYAMVDGGFGPRQRVAQQVIENLEEMVRRFLGQYRQVNSLKDQ